MCRYRHRKNIDKHTGRQPDRQTERQTKCFDFKKLTESLCKVDILTRHPAHDYHVQTPKQHTAHTHAHLAGRRRLVRTTQAPNV